MPRLHILCPTQNKSFATSIQCSVEHKPCLPNIIKYSYCPYCRQLHGWTPDEAFFVDTYEASEPRAGDLQQLGRVKAFNEISRRPKDSRRNWRQALPALIRRFHSTAREAISQAMSGSENKFRCPTCNAKYEVVRIEAALRSTTDCEITCLCCGRTLRGCEGKFILKYFLVERPRLRA
jgi:hypothetical protein